MDIQAEKLKLIEWLSQLTDRTLVERIKYLKDNQSLKTDWWQDISQEEKNAIDQGLADLDKGLIHPHESVKSKYAKWL